MSWETSTCEPQQSEEGFVDTNIRKKYFDDGDVQDYCVTHRNYGCRVCVIKMNEEIDKEYEKFKNKNDMKNAQTCTPGSIVTVPTDINNDEVSVCKRARSVESFNKQLEFIQEVLGYSDEKMEKIKVDQIPKLMKRAQNEATVGNMKNLLGEGTGWLTKLVCRIK